MKVFPASHRGLALGILTAVTVGIFALGCGSFATQAQSKDDAALARQFVGMWRLVSRTQRFVDGATRQHPASAAYIIYTDNSRMCYVGMDPNRPRWKSVTAPTESEALSGMGDAGFYAYCATVEIHANEGFVLHHVDLDKVPNVVGTIRKRWFKFQGPNRVSLRIDTPELTPPMVDDTLVWERIPK